MKVIVTLAMILTLSGVAAVPVQAKTEKKAKAEMKVPRKLASVGGSAMWSYMREVFVLISKMKSGKSTEFELDISGFLQRIVEGKGEGQVNDTACFFKSIPMAGYPSGVNTIHRCEFNLIFGESAHRCDVEIDPYSTSTKVNKVTCVLTAG